MTGPACPARLWLRVRLSAGYASYFVSKAVFVLVALPLLVVLLPFPRAKDRVLQALTHRYLGFFSRAWLPALGIYRVIEISGHAQADTRRPAVYVANHRGFMDGIFLLGLLPQTGVLIKARDTRQPLYALLERHFDLVGIDAGSLASVADALARSRRLLESGQRLLVFPEGTRATTGRLQRFNRFAFQLALDSGAPLVPILIHSKFPFMGKARGTAFPPDRNEYRIRFLDPEPQRPDDDAEALSDRVYRRMSTELRALDAGTAWEMRA